MSESDVDIVRRIHETWNKRESPVELGLIAEDIEYVNPPDAMEPGTRRGHEGWGRAMSMLFESYDDVSIEIGEIQEAGEGRVLVLGTLHATGRGSGVAIERAQGYVWTVRDGQAVRLEWFLDHEPAIEAAGIEDPR